MSESKIRPTESCGTGVGFGSRGAGKLTFFANRRYRRASRSCGGHKRQMLIPYSPFTMRIVAKATTIWLAIRVGMLLAGVGPSVGVAMAGGITLLAAGLTVFDVRRRSEHVFLENLGVSWLVLAAMSTLVPAAFETVCAAVLSA